MTSHSDTTDRRRGSPRANGGTDMVNDAVELPTRAFRAVPRVMTTLIAIATAAFFIYTAWYGSYPALIQRSILLGSAMCLVFLGLAQRTPPDSPKNKALLLVLYLASLCSVVTLGFIVVNFHAIAESSGFFGQTEVVLATIMVATLLFATWLAFGPALPIIAICFLLYALFGREMPDILSHRGLKWGSLVAGNYLTTKGVLGVPLANLIGTTEGWRGAFASVAALSFAVAAVCFSTLPKLPGREGVGIAAMVRVLSNSRFLRIFAATVLAITAHFMAFTYIEPYLNAQSGISPSAIAPLLFAFGGAGLAANVVTGGLIDRRLKSVLLVALCLASVALWLLSALAGGLGLLGTTLLLILWGGAIAAVLVGFQTWILKEAGADALPASAIYVAIFNGAIGLGAVLGSYVLTLAGLSQIFLIAAMATAMGTLAILLLTYPATVLSSVE